MDSVHPSGSLRARYELPLEHYALIGDCRTAALVSRDGAIDWWCPDRSDRAAVFCRLLDVDQGGCLELGVTDCTATEQRYLGNTNVLETIFRGPAAAVRVTDFMPRREEGLSDSSRILRRIEGLEGSARVRLRFAPTFDFAQTAATLQPSPLGCIARGAGCTVHLECGRPLEVTDAEAYGDFALGPGESHWVSLSTRPLGGSDPLDLLRKTLSGWEAWASRGRYPGPYADVLRRSALTLKLLIHEPTGAVVASPTTSLPETPGGVRNWDYRFAWLRDASWVVRALISLGYHQESMAFIDWLEQVRVHENPSIFYDLDGRVPDDERELWHLSGRQGAAPVRTGNRASVQDQHDIFGEVISAIHLCSEGMPSMRPLRPALWEMVSALTEYVIDHWEHPDHGLWEQRDRRRQHLVSKLLCWVAVDRAIRLAERDGLPAPLDRWTTERSRIRETLLQQGYDDSLGAFRGALDEDTVDAGALLLVSTGFLPAADPRIAATVATLQRDLGAGRGLLRRYRGPDGLPGEEGAFAACSFWLVDVLARMGRRREARELFEAALAHASPLGLLSEEVDPSTGALLGNYPQAFSHLALIRAGVKRLCSFR
ncbi:MAG: glycoside hydrolase family 15 protein [Myxococcota bacterium]|nr:glycoside hydrolase family 15 protein [Myxococcota bacterium]